ncbi:MAG: ABC transporter substrate-binding protein [SAR324 cluster bacterium]|nr:ABC transporter substrate-binding protein [SAR324 cluster bacterium]
MFRKQWILSTIVLCLILVQIQSASAQSASRPREQTLIWCSVSPIQSLDPTAHRDRETQMVLKHMFESLTTRNQKMEIVPQLATHWNAVNQTTWEFQLKHDVTFHDGSRFTAKDVVFTFQRILEDTGSEQSARKGLFEHITSVTAIDPYTVRFKTKQPWPILPLMLSLQEIIPAHDTQRPMVKKTIGTGPFRFVEMQTDQELVMERYSGYHQTPDTAIPPELLPRFLIFKKVNGFTSQIAQLKKGECDIIHQVPVDSLSILGSSTDISVAFIKATRSFFADINVTKPPFDQINVRQALNYLIDKNVVVQTILYGHGQTLPTILQADTFSFDPDLKPYPYDPLLAASILRQAGITRGTPIKILTPRENSRFAFTLASFLTRAGLVSQIEEIEERKPPQLGAEATWNLFVTSWGNTTLDPVDIMIPKLQTGGRGNYSGYSSPKVDQLFIEAEAALDSEVRKRLYQEIQRIVFEDAPMIFGYAAQEFYAYRNHFVHNFIPAPSGFPDLRQVYLKTER